MGEVVICERCKGWGNVTDRIPVIDTFPNGEHIGYKNIKRQCPDCGGTGRWIKKTEITYKNFEG